MRRKPLGPYELLTVAIGTVVALVAFCVAVYALAYLTGVC